MKFHKRLPRKFFPWRLCPHGRRVLWIGHMGILFCLCCLWILWDSPLRGEVLLYADSYARSVGRFGVFLWGVALVMDWLERFYRPK